MQRDIKKEATHLGSLLNKTYKMKILVLKHCVQHPDSFLLFYNHGG